MLGAGHRQTPSPAPTLHSTYSGQRWGSIGGSLGVGEKGARANSCSFLKPTLEGVSTMNWEKG